MENAPATESVSEVAGRERSGKAAHESTAVRPSDERLRRKLEVHLIELPRSTDHDPVVTEQKAAKRSCGGNAPYVGAALAWTGAGGRRCDGRSVHALRASRPQEVDGATVTPIHRLNITEFRKAAIHLPETQ